jgi:hypothetical protein
MRGGEDLRKIIPKATVFQGPKVYGIKSATLESKREEKEVNMCSRENQVQRVKPVASSTFYRVLSYPYKTISTR